MKNIKYFILFAIGLISAIICIIRFDYLKKYQDLIPLLIGIGFAGFIYFLAVILQQKHEVFRLKYKAYEDATTHFAEFHKEFTIQIIIAVSFPHSHPNSYEIFKMGWAHFEKTMDSLSKFISSITTLKELFSNLEVKKCIDRLEKKFGELVKVLEDFSLLKAIESKIDDSVIKNYTKMILQRKIEIDAISSIIGNEFSYLQKVIIKEMEII